MELPRLEPLYQKYSDQGLAVIAIESMRDRDGALEFIQENNLTYVFLENGEGEAEVTNNVFSVQGHPTSFLADENGKIMFAHLGFEKGDEEQIEEEILVLLSD